MLVSPPFKYLRKSEFLRYHKQTVEICGQWPLALPVAQALAGLQTAMAPLQGRIAKKRRAPLTEQLPVLDMRRNKALTGLHLLASACSRHYHAPIAQAGQDLLQGMDRFGKKLTLLNYLAKTEVIAALVDLMGGQGPMGHATAALPLAGGWAQELLAANEAFNHAHITRATLRAAQPHLSFTALRPTVTSAHQLLANRIVAQQRLYPSAQMAELIAQLNELTEGYRKLMG